MSDPEKKSTFQNLLSETFVCQILPPLSILIVCGAFKRLRNPWIRGSAFAFTATTQALCERDLQGEQRRALVKLLAQGRKEGATKWLLSNVLFHERFDDGTGWTTWSLEVEVRV